MTDPLAARAHPAEGARAEWLPTPTHADERTLGNLAESPVELLTKPPKTLPSAIPFAKSPQSLFVMFILASCFLDHAVSIVVAGEVRAHKEEPDFGSIRMGLSLALVYFI
jgi:hypothetical protein